MVLDRKRGRERRAALNDHDLKKDQELVSSNVQDLLHWYDGRTYGSAFRIVRKIDYLEQERMTKPVEPGQYL